MKKIKLYVYPNAEPHDHDSTEHCVNTVPMSKKGIESHCIIVPADEAEYFYMGQLNNDRGNLLRALPDHYSHFLGNESRHICDIEGEGGFEASNRPAIPRWLHNSIITTMGPLKKYSNIEFLFTRPTFSHLLMDIVDNGNEEFLFPEKISFGLRAYMNHKIRALTVYALHNSNFDKELRINRRWEGLSKIGSSVQQDFIDTMLNNSISLCPRGSGIDSVRLLETCYYNRVPVMISDHDYFLFAEDTHDTSFCYRICKKGMTPEYLHEEFKKIYETPHSELKKKANAARKYFDTAIKEYFEDPTLYFLKWLEKKNEGR